MQNAIYQYLGGLLADEAETRTGARKKITLRNGSGANRTAGEVVTFDLADVTFGKASAFGLSAASANSIIAGVLAGDTADGELGEVVTSGPVVADVAAGTAQGARLRASATAGELDTGAVGTDHLVAHALEAEGAVTAGKALVWLGVL